MRRAVTETHRWRGGRRRVPWLLCLTLLAAASDAEDRVAPCATFDDWVVVCRSQDTGHCSASAFQRSPLDARGVHWQLRVVLPGYFADP